MKRMNLIARAAESIADGDIVNVQIRRYRQWQLSQASSLVSCIIPYVTLSLLWNFTRFAYQILALIAVDVLSFLSTFQCFTVAWAKRNT